MSILHLIYTLFQVVIYGTCFMSLCLLVFSVVQHVSNFEYNREMTPKKKRLKHLLAKELQKTKPPKCQSRVRFRVKMGLGFRSPNVPEITEIPKI